MLPGVVKRKGDNGENTWPGVKFSRIPDPAPPSCDSTPLFGDPGHLGDPLH